MRVRWDRPALAAALLLCYAFAAPAAHATSISPLGQLVAPGQDPLPFAGLAVSGTTAVASDLQHDYVYDAGTNPWSAPRLLATLADPGGAFLGQAAISGPTIAALATKRDPSGTTRSFLDIFTEPPGGWAGTVAPTATFAAPGAQTSVLSVASSGPTIAVVGDEDGSDHDTLYVLGEPSTGWSGTLHADAEASLSNHAFGISLSGRNLLVGGTLDGATAVTGTGLLLYSEPAGLMFTEPAGGWSGMLRPAATLAPASYQPPGQYVFTEPAHGWHGLVGPSTRLLADMNDVSAMALSGDEIALTGDQFNPLAKNFCPCPGHVSLFEKPANGWPPLIRAPAVLTATEFNGVAALGLEHNFLFAGGQGVPGSSDLALDVFDITGPVSEQAFRPGKPALAAGRLSGLRGKPHIHFGLRAGSYAPPIRSLRITLPSGLMFTRKPGGGVRVGPSAHTFKLVHGALLVSFHEPVGGLVVTIGTRALSESGALKAKLAVPHRKLKLRLSVDVVDAAGGHSHLVLTTTV